MPNTRQSFFATMFLVFALGCSALLGAEVSAFRSSAATELPSSDGPTAMSLAGVHQQLEQCELQMNRAARLLWDDTGLDQVAVHCKSLAGNVLRTMPMQPFAHLVLARAGELTGDEEATREHLLRSSAQAPNEGWLAKRRFRLAIAGARAGRNTLAPAQREIPVLVSFQSGVELLARTYVEMPGLRKVIRAAAENSGPEKLQQLIWQVDKATRVF